MALASLPAPINIVVPRCGLLLSTIALFTISVSLLLLAPAAAHAQVVSHELRRLALATNQFGIDALKALDRIEPADRVLVFCPVCLSSSLMMIMMGSSKYQVVSSLRHALYVWSMRPQDINRGFRDVFEHIDLNQNHQVPRTSASASGIASTDIRARDNSISENSARTKRHPIKRSPVESSSRAALLDAGLGALSLPKLIKLREILERSVEKEAPWWHSMSRRTDTSSAQLSDKHRQPAQRWSVSSNSSLEQPQQHLRNNLKDFSQMSAMSNIYIQRGLALNYNYNLLLRQYYKTVIHPVDFLANAEETRQHINSLVAANTESKIKDLVRRGSFDARSAPRAVMISTFHFRGTLDVEMKPKAGPAQTRAHAQARQARAEQQERASDARATPFIETEPSLLKYGHFANLECSVIEIPFNNRLVTLVILMPDHQNVTELLLTRLSARVLSDLVNSLVVKRLSLGIPVIKFDRGPINTGGLLRELGLDRLFFGNQTFSTETGLNRWLRPSDVIHETSIDIGTMNPNWGVPEDRLKLGAHDGRSTESNHINLDKPFFYFVLDSINGLILTMGRIRR